MTWAVIGVVMAALSGSASAATFAITIDNTSTFNWSSGLITLTPIISIGKTPTSGAGYYVYGYATSDCNVVAGDDGNATLLAQNLGLTVGTNAWIVPALNAGKTTAVTIQATPDQQISYITAVYGSGAEAADDIVMMYTGNTSDLSVALFDSNNLPLSDVSFTLAGYDVNSTSATNGNGTSCSPDCPVTGSSCFIAPGNGTTGLTLTPQPAAPQFTLTNSYVQSSYTTDGLALGSLTASTGNELVVVMENGDYDGTYNNNVRGRAAVLGNDLTAISTFDATTVGHDFMGFPMIENVNGGPYAQFVIPEFAPLVTGTSPSSANVYAVAAGPPSAAYFTVSNLSYPGFWNMGTSAGNVRNDLNTADDVVVPAWNGEIVVLPENSATPATLNTYNMQTLGEQLYGHVALANVLGTAGLEIIGFGSTAGTVVALSPTSTGGGMTVAWKSVPPTGTSAIYAFGSGPAVGDLDGDGKPEIVVASATTGAVYAYDPTNATGACKYRWLNTGGFDYAWSSPVIADVNGDGVKEVVVLSSDSVLSVLSKPTTTSSSCQDGVVEWKYTVGNGGPAWFTPALAKLVGSKTGYDVVAANYNTIEVIDTTNKTIAYRYSDASANFYPSAVIDTSTSAVPAIYVSGWANGKVYRLLAPSTAPKGGTSWPSFMGGNTRTGAR